MTSGWFIFRDELFIILKDVNEREAFNARGLLIGLAKEASDDVQQADVTLLLHKLRVFKLCCAASTGGCCCQVMRPKSLARRHPTEA